MEVKLIHSKGDMLVVDAARASFSKQHTEYSLEENRRLINYLAREKHISVFFHNRFTFSFYNQDAAYNEVDLLGLRPETMKGLVWMRRGGTLHIRHSFYGWLQILEQGILPSTESRRVHMALFEAMPLSYVAMRGAPCPYKEEGKTNKNILHEDFIDVHLLYQVPIFTARQEFKHIVGFERNERSGRYVTAPPTMFLPNEWRSKPKGSIKQGSGAPLPEGVVEEVVSSVQSHYDNAIGLYQELMDKGVAPEQARMVLPQAMNTSYVTTASLSGLRRFFAQRSDPENNAQAEIREFSLMVREALRGDPYIAYAWEEIEGEEL